MAAITTRRRSVPDIQSVWLTTISSRNRGEMKDRRTEGDTEDKDKWTKRLRERENKDKDRKDVCRTYSGDPDYTRR